jgi:hypothetical protein
MSGQVRRVAFIALLAFMSGIISLRSAAGQSRSPFEGKWQGNLEVVYSSASKDPQSVERVKAAYAKAPLKIHINGQQVRVYFGGEEVKPGLFQLQAYQANAVIFASSAGDDRDGRWVETWNFTLTEKSPKAMIVCLSRVVNNLDLGETKDDGKFGLFAIGEFQRTSN